MTTANTLKTVALLGLLGALLIVMNLGSHFFSQRTALSSYSAPTGIGIYQGEQPIVPNFFQRMKPPMPKLWLIPPASPNAFATGRNPAHSSVAFTRESIVAHERGPF